MLIDPDRLTNWYDFQAPFYHLWRDRYDSMLVHRAARALDGAPQRVLDAGCGTGLFAIGLARLCRQHIFTGLDRSAGMLAVGRRQARRFGLDNVSFQLGTVEKLPFPAGSYDTVLASGLMPNLNQPVQALREFARVLRPGGRLLVVEFDRSSMTRLTRLFFRIMIAGYRIASACCRRFRFAEGWSVRASTIDEERFRDDLRAAGFAIHEVERLASHLIVHCRLTNRTTSQSFPCAGAAPCGGP
jgi:ubiquinone/menaquinone biosynthesis C-methylase UbiE